MQRQSSTQPHPDAPSSAWATPERGLLPVGKVRHTLVAVGDPGCGAAECLRGVAMRLMAAKRTNQRSRVLAIVSPARGDGRSFVAANLATIFAQAGQRTLLIDADMRSPRQHELFHCDAAPGLAALLCHQPDASVARSIDGLPGLRVITAGELSSPSDTWSPAAGQITSLGSENFGALLDDMRASVDQVIIDTPAGADYVDAEAIAARAGAALMIMRRNVTRLHAARRLADQIHASGARVVGTILNRR